jgi:hypothetical protein
LFAISSCSWPSFYGMLSCLLDCSWPSFYGIMPLILLLFIPRYFSSFHWSWLRVRESNPGHLILFLLITLISRDSLRSIDRLFVGRQIKLRELGPDFKLLNRSF